MFLTEINSANAKLASGLQLCSPLLINIFHVVCTDIVTSKTQNERGEVGREENRR